MKTWADEWWGTTHKVRRPTESENGMLRPERAARTQSLAVAKWTCVLRKVNYFVWRHPNRWIVFRLFVFNFVPVFCFHFSSRRLLCGNWCRKLSCGAPRSENWNEFIWTFYDDPFFQLELIYLDVRISICKVDINSCESRSDATRSRCVIMMINRRPEFPFHNNISNWVWLSPRSIIYMNQMMDKISYYYDRNWFNSIVNTHKWCQHERGPRIQ